jgi:hypothetical protein
MSREVAAVMNDDDNVRLTEAQKRRQRARSIAIGLALVALAVLFYVITIARLGGDVASRPL